MQSISRNHLTLFGNFALMLGIGFLVAAGVLTTSTYRFVTMASRAEGTVIHITPRNAQPVIQVMPTERTTAIEFLGTGIITKYTVGDKVPVLYLPDDQYPSGFQTSINALDALWPLQLFLTALGATTISESLYIKRMASRQS
jgi:hypothetical protein